MRHSLKILFAWTRRARRLLPTDRVVAQIRLGAPRPQGYVLAAREWLAEKCGAGECKELWPAERCALNVPDGFGSWAEAIRRDWTARIVPGVHGYMFSRSVRYWGYYGGVYINAENRILGDLSPDVWGLDQHYAFAVSHLPKCTHHAGIVVVLTTPEARGNYWHWTVELLPKIGLLDLLGIEPSEVAAFVVNMAGAKYEAETLEELLPTGVKIIPSTKRLHLSADRLVAFSSSPHRYDFHPRAIHWLNDMRPRSGDKKKKIFVTRASAKKRRILNEQQLISALVELGFEVCDPAKLSVREQREIFRQAGAVVGCHGAGLTNLVWCERGTCVVEIHAPSEPGLFYWRVCETLGLRYHPVFGVRRKGRRASRSLDDDFVVEVAPLRTLLETISEARSHLEARNTAGTSA